MTKTMNISANPSQPCTFASRTSQRTNQSLQKSMSAPTQEKIQNIFPFPSKKIKTPDTQADTTGTIKCSIDNSLQGQTTRTTGYNKVLAKKGLTEVIEQLCFYQLLCIYSADGFQMPLLRQYPNRYRLAAFRCTHGLLSFCTFLY